MPLQELLDQQGYVVLDGGLATELEALGANLNDSLWSAKLLLEAPQILEQVNYAYLCAGADIATTASYQATIPGLMAKGLTAPQSEAKIRLSVDLARQARDRFWSDEALRKGRQRPLVVASIGPYGAYLHDGSEYLGHYGLTRDQLKDFHRARLAILVESQADLLAFESFPSQLEAEAVVELLGEFPNAACWISFTCKDETRISEGTTLATAVHAVARSPQVLAVGVNCVAPRYVDALLHAAKQQTDKPLVAYPNSGECFDAATGTWQLTSELAVIQNATLGWYHAGARLIGGCCRTTPDTIRAIRASLAGKPLAPGKPVLMDESFSRRS
jgi:homocysteine S-methyltransferase